MNEPTLRIAYLPHAASAFIYEHYSDGSIRRVLRPKSVAKMDKLRRKYGAAWKSVTPDPRRYG